VLSRRPPAWLLLILFLLLLGPVEAAAEAGLAIGVQRDGEAAEAALRGKAKALVDLGGGRGRRSGGTGGQRRSCRASGRRGDAGDDGWVGARRRGIAVVVHATEVRDASLAIAREDGRRIVGRIGREDRIDRRDGNDAAIVVVGLVLIVGL